MNRIYLDHAATSPLLPEVREAMLPWLHGGYGNPSSQHKEGREARAALDEAREKFAEAVGAQFSEVVFTSGATESANLALIGLALAYQGPRKIILLSSAEHKAVLETQPVLERLGFQVTFLPVNRYAQIETETLRKALSDDVLLVAAMHTNNEFGSVNSVSELAEITHKHGSYFVCDAVQTSFVQARADLSQADLTIFSGHKHGGPKGVGALLVKTGIPVAPLIAGGEQERERRGGTEALPLIIGFGVAAELDRQPSLEPALAFREAISDFAKLTCPESVPKIVHCRVPGISAESLLLRLDREGIAASSGAACSSGSIEPSHVMLAAGYTVQEAKEALRFSFGPQITMSDAQEAALRLRHTMDIVSSTISRTVGAD